MGQVNPLPTQAGYRRFLGCTGWALRGEVESFETKSLPLRIMMKRRMKLRTEGIGKRGRARVDGGSAAYLRRQLNARRSHHVLQTEYGDE